MDYATLYERLTSNLRDRIRRGEITERGLARMTFVSQPHIHHVLKGKRALSAEMADRIMRHLRIDLLDLIEPGEFLEWRRRQ
jgi:transcriptional regulator with XRE-family HTH domain